MALIDVHQTTLAYENSYIFVTNIKIPTVSFQTVNLTQRIEHFVNFEYSENLEVYFEITASYTLVHTENGSLRKWVGSFSPLQNFSLTQLALFRERFNQTIEPLLDIRHLSRQIQHLIPNTHWALEEVESLIVNVSAVVPSNYYRLIERGLINQYGRRGRRKIKHSILP